jgi:hypothetical protein
LAVIALVALLGAAVTIVNESDRELRNLEVSFGDGVVWAGDLKAHESKWMWGVSHGGAVSVIYDLGQQRISYGCGYLYGVFDGHQSFTIEASGFMPDCVLRELP